MRRHGVLNLRELQREQHPPLSSSKGEQDHQDYEPSFEHIDIKYLLQMPDEDSRRYPFVAIDRATRWVFVRIYPDQERASSCDFCGACTRVRR